MDLYTAIYTRRSVRPGEYTDAPVDRDTLERLLEAANMAPSHKKTFPWRFVVFESAAAKTSLGEFMADAQEAASDTPVAAPKLRVTRERPGKSAAALAIVMAPRPDLLPEWEDVSATACAVENLWLAATAEGLAGYWSSPGTLTAGAEKFLGLKAGEKCLGLFYLGYPEAKPGEVARKPVDEIAEYR